MSLPSRSTFSRTMPHCGRASARITQAAPVSSSASRSQLQRAPGRLTTRPHSGRATRPASRAWSRRAEGSGRQAGKRQREQGEEPRRGFEDHAGTTRRPEAQSSAAAAKSAAAAASTLGNSSR